MILDDLANCRSITRIVYGLDENKKPNDHCYWNYYFEQWEENDEHLRNRRKELLK